MSSRLILALAAAFIVSTVGCSDNKTVNPSSVPPAPGPIGGAVGGGVGSKPGNDKGLAKPPGGSQN